MSSGPAEAETGTPSPDSPHLLARFTGILLRPRSAFATVIRSPRWVGLLTTLTAASFAVSALFFTTDVGRQALVDQWERTALAFGRPMDEARYATMQELSRRYAIPYAAGATLVRGPVAALAIATVVYGVFAVRGAQVAFRQVITTVVHAGVILTLRDIVAAPINYVRESVASPLTLLGFIGIVDESSPVARFLALLDVFVVWWVLVLAIGIATLYGIRARVAASALVGVYIGVSVLLAGAMAVLGANG